MMRPKSAPAGIAAPRVLPLRLPLTVRTSLPVAFAAAPVPSYCAPLRGHFSFFFNVSRILTEPLVVRQALLSCSHAHAATQEMRHSFEFHDQR